MESTGKATGRSVAAGAVGGVLAVVALVVIATMLFRCLGPRIMRAMMERMMGGGCSEQMRACMEKCGCGRPASTEDTEETAAP